MNFVHNFWARRNPDSIIDDIVSWLCIALVISPLAGLLWLSIKRLWSKVKRLYLAQMALTRQQREARLADDFKNMKTSMRGSFNLLGYVGICCLVAVVMSDETQLRYHIFGWAFFILMTGVFGIVVADPPDPKEMLYVMYRFVLFFGPIFGALTAFMAYVAFRHLRGPYTW